MEVIMPKPIAIAGIMGAMGRNLAAMAAADGRFMLVGGTEAPNSAALNKHISDALNLLNVSGEISSDITVAAKNAKVFIDFTRPAATLATLEALKATECKAVVIGTTGFSEEENKKIKAYAKHFAIVKTGNFSLGVNLLSGFVKKAAAVLGEDWDIEIIEAHHRRKVDAPSGTAILLGESAAEGRGKPLSEIRTPAREGITGARVKGSIGFSAIRGGGIVGEHDVRFESETESLVLSHKAWDRSTFAKGALEAALWVADKPHGLYDMHDVLGL